MKRIYLALFSLLCATGVGAQDLPVTPSYKKVGDPNGAYPYMPQPYTIIDFNNFGLAKLFASAYRSDIEQSNENFLFFYDVELVNPSHIEIKKRDFVDVIASTNYTKDFSEMLARCINSYPPSNNDEIKEIFALIEFLYKGKGKEESDTSKQIKLIEELNRQSNLILPFIGEHNGQCPPFTGDIPAIPERNVKELEDFIDAIFMLDTTLPDRDWNHIARYGLFDLIASKQGLWYQASKDELLSIYQKTIKAISTSQNYFGEISNKEYRDFYDFASNYRQYLTANAKSDAALKEIGLACIESVEDTFKPFILNRCIELGKLSVVNAKTGDGFILVRKDK